MADNTRQGDTPEVALDLDEQSPDLETAMREAMAAVEGVETGARAETAGARRSRRRRRSPRQSSRGGEAAPRGRRPARPLHAHAGRLRQLPQAQRAREPGVPEVRPAGAHAGVPDGDRQPGPGALGPGLRRGPEAGGRDDPPPDAGAAAPLRRHRGARPWASRSIPPSTRPWRGRRARRSRRRPCSAELRRGYKMHDRLLRPAMVKVAVPAESAAPAPVAGGEEGAVL